MTTRDERVITVSAAHAALNNMNCPDANPLAAAMARLGVTPLRIWPPTEAQKAAWVQQVQQHQAELRETLARYHSDRTVP